MQAHASFIKDCLGWCPPIKSCNVNDNISQNKDERSELLEGGASYASEGKQHVECKSKAAAIETWSYAIYMVHS